MDEILNKWHLCRFNRNRNQKLIVIFRMMVLANAKLTYKHSNGQILLTLQNDMQCVYYKFNYLHLTSWQRCRYVHCTYIYVGTYLHLQMEKCSLLRFIYSHLSRPHAFTCLVVNVYIYYHK